MAIHTRFKELLDSLKVNGNQLAKELNLSQTSISRILGGNTLPSSKVLIPLAKKYPKINLTWLLIGEGEMFISNNKVNREHLDRLADSLERENNLLRERIDGLDAELEEIRKEIEAMPEED
jgi:transcriptional regulator with XRE-family HTH domain